MRHLLHDTVSFISLENTGKVHILSVRGTVGIPKLKQRSSDETHVGNTPTSQIFLTVGNLPIGLRFYI